MSVALSSSEPLFHPEMVKADDLSDRTNIPPLIFTWPEFLLLLIMEQTRGQQSFRPHIAHFVLIAVKQAWVPRNACAPLVLLSLALPSASQWGTQNILDDGPTVSDSIYTVFNHTIKRVAVIGAGPAGLQAAAQLVKDNFTVRLFEQAPGPGGNWLYSDEVPLRESYPDAPVHLPQIITGMPDIPYVCDKPWMVSHYQIQSNVSAYASFHNLNSNDDNGNVTSVTTWVLTLHRLEHLHESNRIKATWWTEDFDAVTIANGCYFKPHVPDIKGLMDWSAIKEHGRYSIYHLRTYRRPKRYAGKTALIIGTGTSGSEIAQDLDRYAHKILATKRAKIASLAPIADLEHRIHSGKIILINGMVLEGVNEIILATGYSHANPFLVELLNRTSLALKQQDEEKDPIEEGSLPNVY
ncbi:hypothetical protein C8J56DRAFT_1051412 [Mycena floridula]|nr:hypothetical protein C8J56DRAFT_1051412 [Mycena floridula]